MTSITDFIYWLTSSDIVYVPPMHFKAALHVYHSFVTLQTGPTLHKPSYTYKQLSHLPKQTKKKSWKKIVLKVCCKSLSMLEMFWVDIWQGRYCTLSALGPSNQTPLLRCAVYQLAAWISLDNACLCNSVLLIVLICFCTLV